MLLSWEVDERHQLTERLARTLADQRDPGNYLSAHRSYEQKREQANYFREVAEVPWPVLVDELDGEEHKQYELLPNSVFLLDIDGRV